VVGPRVPERPGLPTGTAEALSHNRVKAATVVKRGVVGLSNERDGEDQSTFHSRACLAMKSFVPEHCSSAAAAPPGLARDRGRPLPGPSL
jgi:hypothetical protein